jgi:DNA-binding winged helix-turn-helix (wHTH) protein
MLHPDVRAEYLSEEDDAGLLPVLISSQLAAEGPEALFRRLARALRRADPDTQADFRAQIDQVWLEDYLEDLADRQRRLVLMIDEFEVLAGFEPRFWEWFEKLVTGYDVSMVVTARVDLGEFRTEQGEGPPFFNMFRSVYVGSFCQETVDVFLKEKSEITEFDFIAVQDVIEELAGRFPYYMQVLAALFYLHAGGSRGVTDEQMETIRTEYRVRTQALFDDAWHKLPQSERDALTVMVMGKLPDSEDDSAFAQALQSLERRAYVIDGRIFSSSFADQITEHIRRISVNPDTERARIGTRVVELSPRSFALLSFLLDHEGQVVTRSQIAEAVWPEQEPGTVSDEMVDESVAELVAVIDADDSDYEHVEQTSAEGYRFLNAPI